MWEVGVRLSGGQAELDRDSDYFTRDRWGTKPILVSVCRRFTCRIWRRGFEKLAWSEILQLVTLRGGTLWKVSRLGVLYRYE